MVECGQMWLDGVGWGRKAKVGPGRLAGESSVGRGRLWLGRGRRWCAHPTPG